MCPGIALAAEAFAAASIWTSTWLMVFALGLMEALAAAAAAALVPAMLFFLARLCTGVALAALSRRLRGREDGVVVWWSFC